eukprot:GEMP01020465.1.p1 GENE.GEMP01020465.1~~GEMP01020465.1.p1  ORF type:complete len:482 (+),score=93.33 GEMP01020465.1:30-1475(+)
MATSKTTFAVIVAATPNRGIGANGALPWKRLPADMAYFKRITMTAPNVTHRNAVIMGRNTWESIPDAYRPLKGRYNVVVSSKALDSVDTARSFDEALEMCGKENIHKIFIIGGCKMYEEALRRDECTTVYLTRVGRKFDNVDVFMPELPSSFSATSISKTKVYQDIPYDFAIFERHHAPLARSVPTPLQTRSSFQHEEQQYLDMIHDIICEGVRMDDRTGVGTVSKFGTQMRFSLRESFPLLTTKRVYWKGVLEELLWFVRGDTNQKTLFDKGVHIWDKNATREFLDGRGLTQREEGDLGPVYGFQWRHFGAKYVDMHTDYTGQGVDQLAQVIKTIKTNPTDRRIIISAWNPADLDQMALPPCHMFCQFYVANGELSCLMYQRSCDMGLGVPFNIASYSLLTLMMAQVCGLKPGEFIHTLGNAHVYTTHIEPLKEQLERCPRPFPIVKLNPDIKDIDGFKAEDFELIGYNPCPKIAMEMAV